MVISIAINKTFIIHDLVKKLFMTQCFQPKELQYFQYFNIHKIIWR